MCSEPTLLYRVSYLIVTPSTAALSYGNPASAVLNKTVKQMPCIISFEQPIFLPGALLMFQVIRIELSDLCITREVVFVFIGLSVVRSIAAVYVGAYQVSSVGQFLACSQNWRVLATSCLSVLPSACPRGPTLFPLDGFSCILILGIFFENYRENPNFVKIWYCTWKTCVHLWFLAEFFLE
jgi:hypothetical protein